MTTMCWFIWLRWNRWVRQRQAREEALELGFTDKETRDEKAIEGPKIMRLIEAKPSSILNHKGKRATRDTELKERPLALESVANLCG